MYLNFKILSRTYFKCRKKSLLVSNIMGILIVFLVISSLMVWFAYRENYYSNYIANHNWYSDAKWSVAGSRALNFTSGIQNDYFDNLFTELGFFFENNTDGLIVSHTDLISCVMTDSNPYDHNPSKTFAFHTIRANAEEIYKNSLIKGIIPSNFSELLLLQVEGSTQNYDLNETLSIRPDTLLLPTEFHNYTISGILDNVGPTLEMLGYSSDIVTNDFFNVSYFHELWGSKSYSAHFFTTPENFIKIINNYSFFNSLFYVIMDCSYNTSLLEYSELNNNFNRYLKYSKTATAISANTNLTFYIGEDIYSVLNDYQLDWKFETIKVFALTILLVFLILLMFIEILHFKEKELETIFELLKISGLDDKTLNKVILLDSFIVSTISFIGGTIVGILFGVLFTRFLNFPHGFIHSFTFLVDPLYLLLSIVTFGGFFLLNYLFKRNLLKKKEIIVAQKSLKKRNNVIRKIFTKIEFALAILGVLLFISGLFGVYFTSSTLLWNSTPNSSITYLLYLFTLFLFIGACFLLFICFIVCSKVHFRVLNYLSKKLWQRRKNAFTHALKNVVLFSKTYQRLLVGLFLIGISIIPGFLLPSLITRQNEETAILALGCSDLAINSWNDNQTLRTIIESIEGVQATTSIKQLELFHRDRTSSFGYQNFNLRLLVINASEFADTIDLSRLSTNNDYCTEDIKSLEGVLTFFIDSSSARKFNLQKENVIAANELFLTDENLELTSIADFKTFPVSEKFDDVLLEELFDITAIRISLVLGLSSYSFLVDSITNSDIISFKQRLLIRTDSTADLATIKEELQVNLGYDVSSLEDTINDLNDDVSKFSLIQVQLFAILSLVGIICFIILTSNAVYKEQIKIVEINYRLGISRREILNNFLIELLIACTIPLLISILTSIPLLLLDALLLGVNQQYQSFNYWVPFWILCIAFFIGIIIISSSWIIGIYMQLKRYKVVKHE